MNKERILALADAIENETIPNMSFDMTEWIETKGDCGTAGCIAGWALAMELGVREATNFYYDGSKYVVDKAGAYLEIDDRIVEKLFIPDVFVMGTGIITLTEIKKRHAVFVLRHLAETGEVNWELAFDTMW